MGSVSRTANIRRRADLSSYDAGEGTFNACTENPDDRYLFWRAATLAREPSVVLRLGPVRGYCRRSRRRQRSHPAGALVSVLCRLATRWASPARLVAGRPPTAQGAG